MTQATTMPIATARRIRRDPRFRDAVAQRAADDPGWRGRGKCLDHDPDVFFPNAAEDPAPALAICAACNVRGNCLAASLDAGECDGVWGGTTPEERRPMHQLWLTWR